MRLDSPGQYVDFFLGLEMEGARLLHFVNNERQALKQRLGRAGTDQDALRAALLVLEGLASEIAESGEEAVIARHRSGRKG